jgi:aminopeptidase N
VLRGLGEETDDMATKQLPIYVHIAIDQLAHPSRRAALRNTWERGLRDLLKAAPPGSDKQANLLRSFAGFTGKRIPPSSYGGAARSAESLDLLEGLLDGTETLDGLVIAPETRWDLVVGLAAQGRIDRSRVERELAADHTISGQERAAAAVAVIPTDETKAESWQAALHPDVPNETQRSIAYVFDTAGQQEVLAPYLERYLATADTIWDERGVQLASTLLEYMFPRVLTHQETLDRVDEWLASTPANPAAKKYVLEARDDVARARRAQQRG